MLSKNSAVVSIRDGVTCVMCSRRDGKGDISAVDRAIAEIRSVIASGRLEPGSRLAPEPELARALGMSRNSVREAVKALVHAGVLEVRRGDGTFVTSLKPEVLLDGLGLAVELIRDQQLLEVMEVRRLLEPAATAVAASRIDAKELGTLRLCLERMRNAREAEELVEHDARFHDCVISVTGNQALMSVLRGLSTATLRARIWRAAVEAGAALTTVTQHEEIYDALAAGDSRLAEAAALVHVCTSERWLREHFAEKELGEETAEGRVGGRDGMGMSRL